MADCVVTYNALVPRRVVDGMLIIAARERRDAATITCRIEHRPTCIQTFNCSLYTCVTGVHTIFKYRDKDQHLDVFTILKAHEQLATSTNGA